MADSKVIPFQATPTGAIPGIVDTARTAFRSQKTKPLEYRLVQLRKLYWGIVDNEAAVIEACKLDLGKPSFETYVSELDWLKNDIIFVTGKLASWMKDEKPDDIPMSWKLMSPKIRKEPLGTVLVIGAFNFPLQLSLGPMIGAIAAGCSCILKPSEVSPNTAMIMKKIVGESLDPEAYSVVNGGIEESTTLLNQRWDKIFYTGSPGVGTIIAKKAAETLTPVCLELGGRNPAIVTKNADPRLAARRLLWGKLYNAGQVCISQNYIMVEDDILQPFIAELKKAKEEFYPNGTKASPDYGRIVNKRHFLRIKKMLDDTEGKILIGGEVDEAENYIDVTVVQVNSIKDSMIAEESFGPLMPILVVKDVEDAIRNANDIDSTPLGIFPFGNDSETSKILNEVTSGGASVNDAFSHASIGTLPFGGIGNSGQGAYRGKASFDTFTHRRSVTKTPGWMESLLDVRYPPSVGKLAKLRAGSLRKPDFDRDGKQLKGIKYWLGLVIGMGGSGISSVLVRWVVVTLLAVGAKRYVDTGKLPSWR